MNKSKPSPLRRRFVDRAAAFTLLELLSIIGIIGILASLLVPTVLRGMEKANTTKCASNLRQISAAALQYSAENDGRVVPRSIGTSGSPVTYRVLLLPYLQSSRMKVFVCPADKWAKKMTVTAYTLEHGTQPTSYAINAFVYSGTFPNPGFHDYVGYALNERRLPLIPHPASTIFLCDTGQPDSVSAPYAEWTENGRSVNSANFGQAQMPNTWSARNDCIYPRHAGGRVNVAFYDGHVANLDLKADIVDHPRGDPRCLYDYH